MTDTPPKSFQSILQQQHHASGNPFSRPQTPHHSIQVGFVGLGAMGYPMAKNLANHRPGHQTSPLLVWNRTKTKAEQLLQELGEQKISVADDLEQIANECDVIFTNLANDEVVKEVFVIFEKALSKLPSFKSKIFVETSTIYPLLAGELDTLISTKYHARLVMAPVFGPPPAAESAQLIIVMAGDYRSKKEIAHMVVPAVGRKVIDLGGNLEKASTFKLIGNSLILGSLEILAEALTLGEKSGIPSSQVHSLIKDILPAPPLINYGEKMVHDLFDGTKGFAIDGGIKDATHIRRLTTEMNSPMPALDSAHQHLLTARALHAAKLARGEKVFETLDWSSLVAGARVAAGLDGFDSAKHTKVEREE
ncbi:NAD(P)-binding protein [Panus rudis PR-1116 ss-1]|nr:NAD(P)-binding protein [Panus rudis PR-1116 ss-1]